MSEDLNPYSPPAPAQAPAPALLKMAPAQPRVRAWMRILCIVQCVVIVLGIGGEYYHIGTIVVSGPIMALVALLMVALGIKKGFPLETLHGAVAFSFAVFIFLLINLMGWGPPQADQPVKILSAAFVIIALPTIVWLAIRKDNLLIKDGPDASTEMVAS